MTQAVDQIASRAANCSPASDESAIRLPQPLLVEHDGQHYDHGNQNKEAPLLGKMPRRAAIGSVTMRKTRHSPGTTPPPASGSEALPTT